jgi:uncharacterized protein YlxW (UPF0749 family)
MAGSTGVTGLGFAIVIHNDGRGAACTAYSRTNKNL